MGTHIVLYEPEIPFNTGNIARTCLATNTTLHLIHPLGFSTDDKMLKRAGLDYWKNVDVHEYDSLDSFYLEHSDGEHYFIENFGTKQYTDFDFSRTDIDQYFIFGKETTGIPREVIKGKEGMCLRIPTTDKVRSLNLSNCATIILYEVLRQQKFNNLI